MPSADVLERTKLDETLDWQPPCDLVDQCSAPAGWHAWLPEHRICHAPDGSMDTMLCDEHADLARASRTTRRLRICPGCKGLWWTDEVRIEKL